MYRIKLAALFMSFCFFTSANDLLKACWEKQARPITDKYLSVQYREHKTGLSHSMNPWDEYSHDIKGVFTFNNESFSKVDTLTTKSNNQYYSSVHFEDRLLLSKSYRSDDLSEVDDFMLNEQLMASCRYSPVLILDYCYKNLERIYEEHLPSMVIYHIQIAQFRVSLYLDKEKVNVSKIKVISDLESDDQYYGIGDVIDEFQYDMYDQIDDFHFPREVAISKLNGKLQDKISINKAKLVKERAMVLEIPEHYKIARRNHAEVDITVEKYTDHIFFINLHHCGTRSMMVEFEEFVFVAESPLNSENGALLLNEVHKIAPNKPIKYFAFGHFHPHYTGGMRPFIHKGAEIICVKEDQSYVEFIANATHSIKVDSLQLEPKNIKYSFVEKQKVIEDASMKMHIYHIGGQSNHTNDYLIYYFPALRMLFQDDLVSLNENSTKENLSKTTKGLYSAIKKLGIEVDEIVQNWHVFDKSNPMKFNFADIARIMEE